MSPEVARQLKDAGFPQHQELDDDCDGRPCFTDACVPTLSELVEACGFDFRDLSLHSPKGPNSNPRWIAKGGLRVFGHWRLFCSAAPDHAVAKLWLALNPRNVSLERA